MVLKELTPLKTLFLLVVSVAAVLVSWGFLRAFLFSVNGGGLLVRSIDITITLVLGLLVISVLSQLMARRAEVYVGPTQLNVISLIFQIVGFTFIIVTVFSFAGVNLVSALVGVGFFGLVVGLGAQTVLGNLFSGLMLLASRPFRIGDRIALVAWQFGKFPPTLSHGWLEPSHTGRVKEITLLFTKILTDSGSLVTVPNGIVTQSLIQNLSYDRHGRIGTQFEVPIQVDPDVVRSELNSALSKIEDFKGEEENFEILEISPSSYLISVTYRTEKRRQREMKAILFRALRAALMSVSEKAER